MKARGDYDAEGRAIFTLRELEAWLAIQIAGIYHHRFIQPWTTPLSADGHAKVVDIELERQRPELKRAK